MIDPYAEGWQFLSWTPLKTVDRDITDSGLSRNWRDWSSVTIYRMVEIDGERKCQEETVRVPYKDLQYWGRNWTETEGRATLVKWIVSYLPKDESEWEPRRVLGASKTYSLKPPVSA